MRTLERLSGLVATLTLGCSAVLGIGDLPTDGGIDASSTSAATDSGSSSEAGSSGGVVTDSGSGGSSEAGTSSGVVTDSGSGSSEAGSSSGVMDSGNGAVAAFLGTWQLTGGSQTYSQCTNAGADGPSMEPTTITLEFTAGTTSDLVGTYGGQGSSGCTFLANVSGMTATAPAGQTCTEFVGGDTEVLALTSYTFMRSGNTAEENATAVLTDMTNPAACDISGTATYTKM